jgi:hypothetical protein
MIRGIFGVYKDSIPELYQQCPFEKPVKLNISINNKLTGFLPEGGYQYQQSIGNGVDNFVFAIALTFDIEK